MQLSILIASNRTGLLACSRIAQACSWAGPNLEVIVRDNSGDAEKRALLPHFRRDNCNIIIADPCDGLTNLSEGLRLVKGDFVFLLADDDFCFDHAIASLPSVLSQCRNDPSVVGVTGAYAVEGSQGSSIVSYQNAESDDVAARVGGYLRGPRIIAPDCQAPRIYPRMIPLCSRFDSVLFTPKTSAIACHGNYSRSP
jgi:hypothetical protein